MIKLSETKSFKQHVTVILLGTISRLIPHPANFTAIGGLSIWTGREGMGAFDAIISMVLADLILGFDSWYMRLIVYGALGIMYLTGKHLKNLWLASIVGSLAFYLITNTGVWLTSSMYVKNLSGLVQSLYMGLPFLRNALIADVLFAQILRFGDILINNEKALGDIKTTRHTSINLRGLLLELVQSRPNSLR